VHVHPVSTTAGHSDAPQRAVRRLRRRRIHAVFAEQVCCDRPLELSKSPGGIASA
jgi:hypothetical protein